MHIIYLNGPSSSGKSTLSQMLQQQLPTPYLHVGIDKLIGMMPAHLNNWEGGEASLGFSWKLATDPEGHPTRELIAGPVARRLVETYGEAVVTMAKHFDLIIDDVAFGKEEVDLWHRLLGPFPTLWVGVHATLEDLQAREAKRPNRMEGGARDQFYRVHRGVTYDLEINTSTHSLEECASKIVTTLETSNKFTR